jgi:dTDP-4-dehydrorhamnose reductase
VDSRQPAEIQRHLSGRRETVFITGGSGLLALNWAIARRDADRVVLGVHQREVNLRGADVIRCRLDSVDEVGRALDVVQPNVVIHAAGLTNVEACEADPSLAQHVNVELAANVATACAARGLALVHISTDHLFRGNEPLAVEEQAVAPQNVYGRTKAEAERRVLDAHPRALVARTNFYGWGTSYRHSFSDAIIVSLRSGEEVTLFTDVFFTPVLVDVLQRAVDDLLTAGVTGVVHIAGDDRLSKYEFGLKLARQFDLNARLIRPGLLAEAAGLVPRPNDMSLSNSLVRRLLRRPVGTVDEHLLELQRQEQDGRAQEQQTL